MILVMLLHHVYRCEFCPGHNRGLSEGVFSELGTRQKTLKEKLSEDGSTKI